MEKRKEKIGLLRLTLESSLGRGPAVSLWLKPKAAPKNGGTEDWRIKLWYVFSDTPLAEGLANLGEGGAKLRTRALAYLHREQTAYDTMTG